MNHPLNSSRRIAIIGGGISGLTAAYILARARSRGAPVDEFLIEAGDRLGGVIRTERVEGFLVEGGPDSFIAEKPEAAELCEELGLGDQLIGSNDQERKTYILHGGRLVPLPDGLMFLVPTSIWPVVTSSLLSVKSKVGIVAEWFSSPSSSEHNADESVAHFVGRHFGKEMLDNIVEPLLAGVYGGDAATLSVASVLPRFRDMERKHGSLVRGALELKKQRNKSMRAAGVMRPRREAKSLFMTLKNGLGDLIRALAERVEPSRLCFGKRVVAIGPSGLDRNAAYRIHCEQGSLYDADAVILAMPAHECAKVLSSLDSELADNLRSIPYSSALTVALGFDAGIAGSLPAGFGFLVPRKEHRRLLACTFMHKKFSGRAPEGKALLRCFLRGSHDPGVLNLVDTEILSIVRQELRSILKIEAEPLFYRVFRWPAAMAQYTVGHSEKIELITRQIQKHPQLYLAGNAYLGIGLSDCIRTGKQAADQILLDA